MKRALSHSQAEAVNQCEMKFKYAHIDSLEPKSRSTALMRGTNGHKFFEVFFLEIKKGMSTAHAMQAGQIAMMEESDVALLNLPLVTQWVQEVWEIKRHTWEVVLVEETHRIELGDLGQFPYTMDLIIRHKLTGELWMVDHKFLGQFYSEDVMDLMPQMPKYIAAYEAQHGVKIAGAIYNMVTTRTNAKDLFLMYEFKVSDARKNNAMREQVETFKAVEEIESGKRLPVRTINKMNCGHCSFKVLCKEEINGDMAMLGAVKDMMFQPNTYGYAYEEQKEEEVIPEPIPATLYSADEAIDFLGLL